MHYIVNEQTKEHRVREAFTPWGWVSLAADSEGWVEWNGGDCPLPDDDAVEVMRRDGQVILRQWSETLKWDRFEDKDAKYDILAYRPVCYHSAQSNPMEMGPRRECSGLPPVGERVEVEWAGKWVEAEVVAHHAGEAVMAFKPPGFMHWEYHNTASISYRTEYNREDDAVREMSRVYEEAPIFSGSMRHVYAAIREGRIPGVKLEDS